MAEATDGGERHGLYEDILAVAVSTLFVSLGVSILIRARILTGGIAGLSLLLQYATGWGFWILFFVLNGPFYWLAWRRMGRSFAIRTLLAVSAECILTRMTLSWTAYSHLTVFYAAVMGGALIGVGLLMLYRHRTSLGGIGILALHLQDVAGLRAGHVQLAFDLTLVACAAVMMPLDRILPSILCAFVTNLIIAINHRPGRYVGFT